MACSNSTTTYQRVISFTAANFNSEEAVIAIIKAIAEDMAEKRKLVQLVKEITDRINKQIDQAFFEQNAADLEALQDLVFDYARSNETDTALLNDLHSLSRTLFRRFENNNSIEGILSTIHAGILYMLVLKAKNKAGINEDENLKTRGEEIGKLIREKADILYDSIAPEKTLGDCGSRDFQVVQEQFSSKFVFKITTTLIDSFYPGHGRSYSTTRDLPEDSRRINPMMPVQKIYELMGDPGLERCNIERASIAECRQQEADSLRDSYISLAESFEHIN
ncbi:hypothetical protein CN432_24205 [Bacillus thuringiensis]|uniref:hypothetical protein n=1 Tax=Bacillus TaxID=1386 RepID=UPI000BF7EC27|nr:MULTISPECIES: hypothetical protein [Bacillus]PEU93981.1 hypothetical protein CN409_21120 [Bacillus sp. AFS012607]PEV42119.1 hypothetical protein CN432_24205 [Bacillus thuringiensis]PFU46601.1 hypothetical protein COK88_24325 [Bacillus cereus]PGO10930.1 hypothetical protein CN972_03500 [Bacillus thuringiensis]